MAAVPKDKPTSCVPSAAICLDLEGMDDRKLRALQAPLKERYKEEPEDALVTLRAQGALDSQKIACKVETGRALAG
jgi:hypothetical protein